MSSSTPVLIFGPTGGVGSATALAAQARGSKVHLAMRNTTKAIPGLSAAQEAAGGYSRVQADLTEAASVEAAARATGAKRAFIYLAHGMPDAMRSTVAALKAGGVEYVVFLSSFSVKGADPADTEASDFIAFAHAQVELALRDAFGPAGYVALRPAWFATNMLWWKDLLLGGNARIYAPGARGDYITPTDIGRVAAEFLASGALRGIGQGGISHVTLNGQELLSQKQALEIAAKVLGTQVTVTAMEPDEALQFFVKSGLPEPLAKSVVATLAKMEASDSEFPPDVHREAKENVQRFSGKRGLTLEEWLTENKHILAA